MILLFSVQILIYSNSPHYSVICLPSNFSYELHFWSVTIFRLYSNRNLLHFSSTHPFIYHFHETFILVNGDVDLDFYGFSNHFWLNPILTLHFCFKKLYILLLPSVPKILSEYVNT